MITTIPQLRRFFLVRHQDETGVSGVGVVAGGIMWPDGTACLRWFTPTTSAAFYNSIADVAAIHGHGGKTEVIFADGPDVQRPACLVCGGGYLGGFCTDCGANGFVATVPEWVVKEHLNYRNRAIKAEAASR